MYGIMYKYSLFMQRIWASSDILQGFENYFLRDAEGHIFIKTSELKDRVQNPAESRLPGGLARD